MPLFRRAVDDLSLPLSYQDIIRQQAAAKHLDPALIAAVIYAETKFDPRTSSAGAQGLMQILPQTAEFLARRSGGTTFTTADLATPAGQHRLRQLLPALPARRVPRQPRAALAAYNGGEANVHRWIAQARAAGTRVPHCGHTVPGDPGLRRKVLQARQDYRHTYARSSATAERRTGLARVQPPDHLRTDPVPMGRYADGPSHAEVRARRRLLADRRPAGGDRVAGRGDRGRRALP